jgi:hypothetical protein
LRVGIALAAMSLLGGQQQAVADDRTASLVENVRRLGDVRPELVPDAVDAALVSETPDWPAEFLLALAYQESRLEPGQRTGLTCGALQVSPRDLEENDQWCGGLRLYSRSCRERASEQCQMWAQDTTLGFQAAVRELDWWLGRRGDRRSAMIGRACGGQSSGCGKGWFLENVRCTEGRIRTGRNVCQYHQAPGRS